jgi:hypothetical protein
VALFDPMDEMSVEVLDLAGYDEPAIPVPEFDIKPIEEL